MTIEIDMLKKELVEKERLKGQTELVLHQLIGQITLLRKLIKNEEDQKLEAKNEEEQK